MKPPVECQGKGWTRRYEDLREQALACGGPIVAGALGLIVLTRQGMSAWMHAQYDPLVGFLPITGEDSSRPVTQGVPWQREATVLLANIAFKHLTQNICHV